MKQRHWIPAFAGVALIFLPALATAEPSFARLYKQQYGYSPSCNACHKDGGGTPLNNYGTQFKNAGMTLAAFSSIATLDGDGDGASNGDESKAKSNPGNASSKPGAIGNWLDIASLIPKEVQEQFPGIRSYLPRDALLTDADIARAKDLGATLSKQDENTIYIPVEDRKPVGTAIIFPATHNGKTFFLLMATDRQLNVTDVRPMAGGKVPEAKNSKVLDTFVGTSLDKLPKAKGDGLDASITRAVKKAGTLVYVRLKGA